MILTDSRIILPVLQARLQLRQHVVLVELVDGLDVGEHLGGDLVVEHVVRSVLLIDAEVEDLGAGRSRVSAAVIVTTRVTLSDIHDMRTQNDDNERCIWRWDQQWADS